MTKQAYDIAGNFGEGTIKLQIFPKAFCLFDNMMAEYVKSNRVKGRKTKIELILEEK